MVPMEEIVPQLDLEAALYRMGGDLDLLCEVGIIFLKECPSALEGLRAAVAVKNPRDIERRAHSLKGSVSTFGAGEAVLAVFELEQQGRNHNLTEVDSNLRRFECALTRLCAELQTLVSRTEPRTQGCRLKT